MSTRVFRRARLRAIARLPCEPPRISAAGGDGCSAVGDDWCGLIAAAARQLRLDAVSVGWANTSSPHGFDQPNTGPERFEQTYRVTVRAAKPAPHTKRNSGP